jgi:hypothetical protein
MKKISDLKGLSVGNKVAVVIRNDKASISSVSGILSGIQVLSTGSVGITVHGLGQWIWLEDDMTVTWGENIGL